MTLIWLPIVGVNTLGGCGRLAETVAWAGPVAGERP